VLSTAPGTLRCTDLIRKSSSVSDCRI
jgi:hypothetical protein